MKNLKNFTEFALNRDEMKKILGGDGCPRAGTKKFYKDELGAGIFTYGFNSIKAKQCKGTIVYKCYGNCGYA